MSSVLPAPDFRLHGRRALVTGAGRGLGLAAATALAQAGAAVTLAARSQAELAAACDDLRAAGHTCDTLVLDVTDSKAVRAALEARAPYQILVNNAGMNRPKPLVDVEDDDVDAVFDLNVKATFYVTRQVARGLLAAGLPGSVINVSSQMGHVGSPRRTLYCASKHAVEGMSKALAWELGAAGIRVNTVCPTFIETAMTAPMFADTSFRDWVVGKIALGRTGRIEEMMGPIVFLASEASSLMTGSALMLDGGLDRGMKLGATAHEVARLAQVSQSAVSRTFTPGASVSEATREKVLAAARTLGYRPNAMARSLTTRKSRIIALVMSYLDNQFYPLVIEKLSQQLQKLGYHVLMFISQDNDADSALSEILQYQVDGIVMASTTLSPSLARDCAETGVPIVLFNRVPEIGPRARRGISSVTCDNREGGRLAAQLLLDRGHRRIAFIAGLENSSTSVERERGFCAALAEAGTALHARAVGHFSFTGAQAAARELFKGGRKPDAVFVANDHMAIAVMDVLRVELGLRVPEDVGVIGFDDVPQAAWGAYQLTTVVQSVGGMVDATVELLHEQISGELKARNVVLKCALVERESVRPPQ